MAVSDRALMWQQIDVGDSVVVGHNVGDSVGHNVGHSVGHSSSDETGGRYQL